MSSPALHQVAPSTSGSCLEGGGREEGDEGGIKLIDQFFRRLWVPLGHWTAPPPPPPPPPPAAATFKENK